MFWTPRKHDGNSDDAVLDRAVADWRRNGGIEEILSAHARARIVDEALDPAHDPAAPASLFLPARRLALAGVLPVMLGVALVLLLGHAGNFVVTSQSARLTIEKRDGQVVFNIANGQTSHYVCKSKVPDRFDCEHGVKVRNGAYADSVRDGAGIVYYRID
jgi:hypothetical protein